MSELVLKDKEARLEELIARHKRVLVAFSGGVDSTYLANKTFALLGSDMLAVTIRSPFIPQREVAEAVKLAEQLGFPHNIIETGLLSNPDFINNSKDRCYVCKKTLFSYLLQFANAVGYDAVFDGSNADDGFMFRPGRKALDELRIMSPLKDSNLNKDEIRELSQKDGLPTYNKPAYACLASRFPYDTKLSEESLSRVEKAEDILFELGFIGHRVRDHFPLARLELRNHSERLLDNPEVKSEVISGLKKLGYNFITLDIEGYRTGCYDDKRKKR